MMLFMLMSVINLFSFADMWKYVALCCGNFLVVDMLPLPQTVGQFVCVVLL